ncbi:ABC transporter permease [Polyangium sp. 15x6]|uniref:ABC transporter permease n=1 Tax=Polyangium sp. 15x6 TaxID=3042687 RepID=UPI00249BB56C|nr:ABC transporter permease [Polyangium sp. 15x6]MDI3291940.1 ABC transporter permease [Polyangium sp. 15x6]
MTSTKIPRKASAGLVILGVFFLMALLGPLVAPYDPSAFVDIPLQPPSRAHLLGTTGQGQDVWSQTIAGARTSLLVGFVAGLAMTTIGAIVGAIAGTFGGLVDDVLSLLTNVSLVIPGLPLAVVLAAYLPAGTKALLVVLVATGWAWNARVIRAQVLSLRNKDFVAAAIVTGESRLYIVFREILPNMTSVLASCFISATVYAIGAQVGLEFLGLGDMSLVTWGTNLYWASNDAALLTGAWWTLVPTGLSVALVGTALVLVSFSLDEITNPRLRAVSDWARALATRGIRPGASTPVVRDHG